jgi:hypothetical protein
MNAKTTPMALAKVEPVQMRQADRAFEPNSMEEAYRLAKILVASRMLPRHLGTPEAAFAVIIAGRELGLTAMQSTRSLFFVEGKVTLSADLMVALVKKHPECEYFRVVEATSERCICETKRSGEEPTRMEWTMADAQRASLTGKDNWKKYPKSMLRARASSELCRAVYPDALMGVYEPDELQREPAQRTPAPAMVVVEPAPAPEAPPQQLVEHDHATGEVPMDDDERADLARRFIDQIHEATTTAQLVDIKAAVKRAAFPDMLRLVISESFTARKKALTVSEASMRQPGEEG